MLKQRFPRPSSVLTHVLILALLSVLAAVPAFASGWLWDQDADGIDDRIAQIETQGLNAAFENNDPVLGRLRLAVFDTAGLLSYGVYVGFDHHPDQADLDMLTNSGVSTAVLHPYQSIDYVRMELTYAEIQTVAALPGVTRVESIPMIYPVNNNAAKTSGVKASNYERFPTVHEHLGITGKGVVVSILDTGVNDQEDVVTPYPGHESFTGKFIAGGNFFLGQPAFNTPINQSENPIDRGEAASSNHGTHVAGTTLGTGGSAGVFGGVAPDADLVDQKVLSDAGLGFGSADGVDWAIANKDQYGIRILNLSLGGVDSSDGTDAGSQAINAAFDAGLLAAIATGNDGQVNYISSPAAADKAVAVGAYADQNSIDRGDDLIADFSNEGPRTDDGDADFVDEMKPLVVAPGAGTVSADGSLLTDGRNYKILSGTSMSTPHVAGVMALLLEAKPDLTPTEVVEILKHTSEHRDAWGKTPASSNPYPQGDPNYHPSGGWGQVDAYAAVKEALRMAGDPASQTQVVFIHGEPDASSSAAIEITWKSQRETDLIGYDLYRADDVGGAPGVFTKITSATIPGTGQEQIEGVSNRNLYSFVDNQGLAFNKTYWYRVEHTSSNAAIGTVQEPALPVTLGQAQVVATLSYSITHDDIGNDLLVLLGSGPQAARPTLVIDGASPDDADAITTEPGDPTLGTLRHDFSIDLTTGHPALALLPPSKTNPWFLQVKEGGYVNRSGRVNDFSITLYDANGNPTATYTTADLTPQQTLEGQTTTLWIPDNPDVFLPGDSPTVIEADPNVAQQDAASLDVEVFGAEMLPGATVDFGAGITVDAVTVESGSRLIATITVDAQAAAGPRDVTVTNLDGGSGSAEAAFTVLGDGGGGGSGGGGGETVDIDDSDPAVGYTQGWHRKASSGASEDGYHVRNGNGNGNASPTASLSFTGSQVTVFYATSQAGGAADIFIDGNLETTLSYAGSSPKQDPEHGHAITFDGLTEGEHLIEIIHVSGATYLDGFEVASSSQAAADPDAVASRSQTSSSSGVLSGLGITSLIRTVEIGAHDEHLSVVVEGSGHPLQVQILDPVGVLLSTGGALLGDGTVSGADVDVTAAGLYTIHVLDLSGAKPAVDVSFARTVRVY